jgi:hypothetical protein
MVPGLVALISCQCKSMLPAESSMVLTDVVHHMIASVEFTKFERPHVRATPSNHCFIDICK